MAHFYLHLRDGDHLIPDEEGVELPNLLAAEHEARLCVRELLADAIKTGRPRVPDSLVIADETGQELSSLEFADVLPKSFKK
jgi:hypothetical protein